MYLCWFIGLFAYLYVCMYRRMNGLARFLDFYYCFTFLCFVFLVCMDGCMDGWVHGCMYNVAETETEIVGCGNRSWMAGRDGLLAWVSMDEKREGEMGEGVCT